MLTERIKAVAILDNLRSAYNTGSIFRTADTVRLGKLFLCGSTPTPLNPKLVKTSLGAEEFVPWEYFTKTEEAIKRLKEENYFIDPDDIIMNEKLNQMKFMTTKDIVNNIIELLNDKSDLNSLLFGVLMMRKFSVIEAVLINKTKEFIENKLYMPILNILNAYYNINQKLTFECLWILSSLVYDSQDKNIYHCLLGDKCIDLYKKIILFYSENQFDNNIMKVMSIFILDILIFKQKEMENENNIINCDLNDDCLLDFLNCFVDQFEFFDYAYFY